MRTTLWILIVLLPTGGSAAGPVDYLRDVKPILKKRCFACHGVLKQESELRLDTVASMRTGGDGGPAIRPGHATNSSLIQRVSSKDKDERMPPIGEPLSPKQIAVLAAWIKQGAKSPSDEKPEQDPRAHWAFRNPVRPKAPVLRRRGWVRNPIDAFVAARQERHGLHPLATAPKNVLLRRVTLDLIGLPPTRAELHAFLAETSPEAYEKVVERLLASPQYGERWGRHWMDVWRYSDWYGRRNVNDVRNSSSQIWRWRDWIIKSLNADKGYDQMIREMLAADEIDPENDENMVALGFIVRNWFSLNYDRWKQDMVEHTGKAFLGLRLNCARCHDHKYDPIPNEEYFRFLAFFEPLELRQDRVPGGPALPKYIQYGAGSNAALRPIKAGLARIYDKNVDKKTFMYNGDARNHVPGKPPVTPAAPAILGGDKLNIQPISLRAVAWYPGLKPFAQQAETAQRQAGLQAAQAALAKAKLALAQSAKNKTAGQSSVQKTARLHVVLCETQLAAAQAQLVAIKSRIAADNCRYKGGPGDAKALARIASQAEREAALAVARVSLAAAQQSLSAARIKAGTAGDKKVGTKIKAALKKAESRHAASLKAVAVAERAVQKPSSSYSPLGPQYSKVSTGRRRALANWIASRKNPLTARVAVNHIWMRHFGRPLVESVYDFGRSGKRPTHPQLLDWLAVELMDSGWSMKHIHRLIVTSNTYRLRWSVPVSAGRSLRHNVQRNLAVDKDNRFYWKFNSRRMKAEVIRDSVLQAAGLLDRTMGGGELDNKLAETLRRRSLYFALYPEGGGTMPFIKLFDPPNPIDCYRRSESIVPQQALAMTNSKLLLNQGRLLARALWKQVVRELEDSRTPDGGETRRGGDRETRRKGEGETGNKSQRLEVEFVIAAFEQILSRRPRDSELRVCRTFLKRQRGLFASAGTKLRTLKPAGGVVPAASDKAMRARESLVEALFSHHDFVTLH